MAVLAVAAVRAPPPVGASGPVPDPVPESVSVIAAGTSVAGAAASAAVVPVASEEVTSVDSVAAARTDDGAGCPGSTAPVASGAVAPPSAAPFEEPASAASAASAGTEAATASARPESGGAGGEPATGRSSAEEDDEDPGWAGASFAPCEGPLFPSASCRPPSSCPDAARWAERTSVKDWYDPGEPAGSGACSTAFDGAMAGAGPGGAAETVAGAPLM